MLGHVAEARCPRSHRIDAVALRAIVFLAAGGEALVRLAVFAGPLHEQHPHPARTSRRNQSPDDTELPSRFLPRRGCIPRPRVALRAPWGCEATRCFLPRRGCTGPLPQTCTTASR